MSEVTVVIVTPDGGVDLTRPGKYLLVDGVALNPSATYAIRLRADNIDLNLGGHTISGSLDKTQPQAGIIVMNGNIAGDNAYVLQEKSISNARIHNGKLTQFTVGILAENNYAVALQPPPAKQTTLKHLQLENLDLSGQVGGHVPATSEGGIYGASIVAASDVSIKKVKCNNMRQLAADPVGTFVSGLYLQRVASLLVEDSEFNGSTGSVCTGAHCTVHYRGLTPLPATAVNVDHTWRRCTFNENSNGEFHANFGSIDLTAAVGLSYDGTQLNPNVFFTKNLRLSECKFNGQTSPGLAGGVETNFSKNVTLEKCEMSNNLNNGARQVGGADNQEGLAFGFRAKQSRNVELIKCAANNNRSEGCAILDNPDLAVRAIGFYLVQSEHSTYVECTADGTSVNRPQTNDAHAFGFASMRQEPRNAAVDSAVFELFDAKLVGCVAQNCTGQGCGNAGSGFGFASANFVCLEKCESRDNSTFGIILSRSVGLENSTAADAEAPLQTNPRNVQIYRPVLAGNGVAALIDTAGGSLCRYEDECESDERLSRCRPCGKHRDNKCDKRCDKRCNKRSGKHGGKKSHSKRR